MREMRFFRRNPSGLAFAGPPACLGSLIWNNQTALAQAKPESPAKAPSRPRRVAQRFPGTASGAFRSVGHPRRTLEYACGALPRLPGEAGGGHRSDRLCSVHGVGAFA